MKKLLTVITLITLVSNLTADVRHVQSSFSQFTPKEGVATYGSACPYTSFTFAKKFLTQPNFLENVAPSTLEDIVGEGRNFAASSYDAMVEKRQESPDKQVYECSVDEIPDKKPLEYSFDESRWIYVKNLNPLRELNTFKGRFCSFITVEGHTSVVCHKGNTWAFFDSASKDASGAIPGSFAYISDDFERIFDILEQYYGRKLKNATEPFWTFETYRSPMTKPLPPIPSRRKKAPKHKDSSLDQESLRQHSPVSERKAATTYSAPPRSNTDNDEFEALILTRNFYDNSVASRDIKEIYSHGTTLETHGGLRPGETVQMLKSIYDEAKRGLGQAQQNQDTYMIDYNRALLVEAGEVLMQHGAISEQDYLSDMLVE